MLSEKREKKTLKRNSLEIKQNLRKKGEGWEWPPKLPLNPKHTHALLLSELK